jgi:nicotinamide-nucleotide amidase
MLPDMIRRGRDPLVGITAHEATITLRIAARGRDEAECLAKMAPTEATIRACLGTIAYGVEDDEIEDAVLAAVAARGRTVASAESGTAGRVAALLAQADGRRGSAGGVFRGGSVVPAGLDDVAAAATEARRRFAATVGLAVGDVRPAAEGRRAVDVAIADDVGVSVAEHVLGGASDLAPVRAAKTAVNLLRLRLLAGGDA